jgi:hypothetical protein
MAIPEPRASVYPGFGLLLLLPDASIFRLFAFNPFHQ